MFSFLKKQENNGKMTKGIEKSDEFHRMMQEHASTLHCEKINPRQAQKTLLLKKNHTRQNQKHKMN